MSLYSVIQTTTEDADYLLFYLSLMTCPHCHGSNTNAHTATAANTPRRWCKDCRKAFAINGKRPGPKPIGDAPMTPVERKRRQRAAN